jgi:hypothetical protein
MNLARAIPLITFSVSIPTRPADIVKRHFNRMAKESMRETLAYHHEFNLPLHFQPSARSRYGYKPRKQSWVMHKQKKWGQGGMDLVATGNSKSRILSKPAQIIIGGAAEGGKHPISGKLTVKFAFSGRVGWQQADKAYFRRTGRYENAAKRPRTAPQANVTLADMKREVRAITPEERRTLAAKFKENLMAKMNAHRAGRRTVGTRA